MGTIWYAYNIENKTRYELGKGAWYEMYDVTDTQEKIVVNDELKEIIARITDDWGVEKTQLERVTTKITLALSNLGDNFCVTNDCTSDYDEFIHTYRLIGSRYD